ncbi:MAG: alpha-2-macroglobulin family protein [Planctomycetota bacterium]|jgi:uncharacterized protein YfaS (alpha-2-macroglobulin family)/tetratricopeptide (TPR) repeat protein
MSAKKRKRLSALLMLAVCMSVAAAVLFAAAAGNDLLSDAQSSYEKHNYKRAVSLCDKILAAQPVEPTAREAKRIRAMSLCRLRDAKGYKYAKEVVGQYPQLEKDAELWLAVAYEREQHWPRKEAFEAYKKAAELYENAGKHTPAADAYFKAAEMLKTSHFLPQPAQQVNAGKTWTGTGRQRYHIEEAIKIYEHIVELKVDDVRKAKALYTAGELAVKQGQWDVAEKGIAILRRCAKEFPATPQAPAAQFMIGETFVRFGRYVEAVREFQLVFQNFPEEKQWTRRAKEQIAALKQPQINLVVEKAYLPGEKAKIYWQIRNVKKVHLTAKSVNLVGVVEKADRPEHLLSTAADMPGQIVEKWSFETPDAGKHQYHRRVPTDQKQTTLPIAVPLEGPGAYLIVATGSNPEGEGTTAYCLIVISRIAAVAKTDGDEAIVYACDARTGEPAGSAEAAVLRHSWRQGGRHWVREIQSGKTNDAGLAELKFERARNCMWVAAVRKGSHQALCARNRYHWYWWGYPDPYKVYGFTERPVYRPGHTVHFKQILRKHTDGVYTNAPNVKVAVAIMNPKGEKVYAKDHITDEFGAVEGSYKVKERAPLGIYRISIVVAGRNIGHWYSRGNQFRVEEYKKPEFKVAVEPAKPDYRVGDEMQIKISARYYFGQPVAGAEVSFVIRKQNYTHRYEWPRRWKWYYDDIYYGRRYGNWRPWWRPRFDELVTRGQVKTNAEGEAFVTVKAEPIKGHEELDLKFVVETEVTDVSRRVIRGRGEVKVTHAPFFIYPKPAQNVYGPGDSVEINIKTENPSGQPVPNDFLVEAWKIQRVREVEKNQGGKETVKFEEKLAQKVYSGKVKVGETGRASVRFVPDVTGRMRIIVRQAEAKKGEKPVEGSCELWIASKTGAEAHYAYNDLKIVPGKDQYEIGEKMKLLVNTNKANSRVLITGEADDLLFHRIVHVQKNSKLVEIGIDKSLCPNFLLTATLLRDGKIFMDGKQIVVPPTHRFLKLDVKVDKGDLGGGEDNKFQPREKTNVRVRITDMHTGEPVVGQVVLMMVDSSIYYIQPEFRQAIEKAFYGFTRYARVSTADSYSGPAWHRRYGYRYGRGVIWADGGVAGGLPQPPSEGRQREAKAISGEREVLRPAPKLAEAVVRKEFRDTVLWAGSVVTDADGTAVVPVTMPDQLTTFALHAIAADKDTKVGQAQSDVITTKRIIVRLESGRFFTEGDHSYVTVIAHNYYEDPQELKVDLAASEQLKLRQAKVAGSWIGYESGRPIDVTVPPGGEVRIDFKTTAERPGDVKLLARARGVRESDALELTKPVVPWGASKIVSFGGKLELRNNREAGPGDVAFLLTVPEEIKKGSQSLTITFNPSIAAVAMEALPFLAAYPYGCTEQTMSRFLPTVVMRKTLKEAGVSLDEVRKFIDAQIAKDPKLAAKWKMILGRMRHNPVYSSAEVEKMIAAGIKRLANFQHGDGGWGWWKRGESDPYMTAYVAFGLSVARDCDVKLPNGMLERAAKFLIARASKPKLKDDAGWWYRHAYNDNTRVYMLHAISRIDKEALRKNAALKAELERLFKARDELTDYGRAYLALTLHAAGRVKDAKTVVENFDNTAVVDKKLNTAHWGQTRGWWYWYNGATETTSWVLQAMLTVSPDDKYVPMAVEWLVHNRRGVHWHNTKTTAMAVYALARYAKVAGELDCDVTFEVVIDGQPARKVRVTRENIFTFDDRVVVAAEDLTTGKHQVRIRLLSKGRLYWGAHLKYFDKSEVIKASGNRIAVKREYFRLVPEEFTNTRSVWKGGKSVTEEFRDIRYNAQPLAFGAEIASGEKVEVRLTINADNNFEYMLFEDPKPSGCEPYRLVSGSTYGGGTYANMELRDTKVVFFATWLRKGESKISYKLVCEQPGTFRVIPTFGEAMYSPFVEAISDSGRLTITEKPQK